jgi:hypothetical protein
MASSVIDIGTGESRESSSHEVSSAIEETPANCQGKTSGRMIRVAMCNERYDFMTNTHFV